jgi:hypothetical protein
VKGKGGEEEGVEPAAKGVGREEDERGREERRTWKGELED